MSKSFIELAEVVYRYPDSGFTLGPCTASFDDGEFTVIAGRNGSGKTTLGKLMVGLLKPDEGKITIDGKDIAEMKLCEIGMKIGYLFQNPSFQLFAATPIEEISFVLGLKGFEEVACKEKSIQMLKAFKLEHLRNKNAYRLSKGEKQSLAMAAVFVNEPEILLFDEPTTGLDTVRRAYLLELMEQWRVEKRGVITISHDKRLTQRQGVRLISMENGRITEDQNGF